MIEDGAELPLPENWTTVAKRQHGGQPWQMMNAWFPSPETIERMVIAGECDRVISRASGMQRLRIRAPRG